MATYTLVITDAHGRQQTALMDLSSDKMIIGNVRDMVSANHPSIAVSRGSGGGVELVGAWNWCGGTPAWTAGE